MGIRRVVVALLLMTILGQSAYARVENSILWGELQKAASISEGAGERQLYIFFDPNCPYCHDLYQSLQPLIGPKQLKIAWIPVGILALSSFGKAAHLLEDKNPTAALAEAERNFRHRKGGLTPRRATPAIAAELASNAQLLTVAGGNGVPFLVYKDRMGRVRIVVGNPPKDALARIIARMQASSDRHKKGERHKGQTAER